MAKAKKRKIPKRRSKQLPPGTRFIMAGMTQTPQFFEQPQPWVQSMPVTLMALMGDPSIPGLMLWTMVTPGKKTTEGHIIEAVTVAWFEIIKVMQNDPQAMHQIDWRLWEEIMAGAYKAAGFDEVILTPRSGDLGRDLIATRNDGFSIRIIDQVKKYAPGNPVSANDVRALLHVLDADRNVSKGYVTTTSSFAPGVFTDPFIRPYMPQRLELRSGPELVKMLGDIAAKRSHFPLR